MMRIEDRKRVEIKVRPARNARRPLVAAGAFASFGAMCVLAVVWTAILFAGSAAAQSFSAADVYRNASSSVVLIFGFEDSGAGSSGTGTILTRDGVILTNNHVIAMGESGQKRYPNLVVYLKPNPISGDNKQDLTTPYLVDVVARDPKMDLAILKLKEPPKGLRPIQVGDSEEVDIGENVAAIGHPGGGGLWTLTTGTVSSKRRDQARDIFQTDTAINPGNSGGPLLDRNARLIGVNTYVRRANASGMALEGLNYSLRSKLALRWVNQQAGIRVAAVSRANDPRPESAPSRREEPRQEAPRREQEPQVAPADEPAPQLREEPRREEPTRRAPEPAPEPETEPEAREFKAPDGTTMYGVPNEDADLEETLPLAVKGFEGVKEKARKSFQEMERVFDDEYDNF